MLEFRRLVLLRELESRESIAAVSRALGVSSSAISQQLSKLEAEVGLPLVEQIGRTVQLTPAGRLLASRVDEAVGILESAEAELEARRSRVQGVVRFAAFSTYALRYLPEVLRRMGATFPDVVVEFAHVEPTEALHAVAGRRADVAITDEYPGIPRPVDPGMRRTLLRSDTLSVYPPEPVADVAGLAGLPWVFEPTGSDAHAWAERVCREAGFEPVVRFESPDLRVHHELVRTGAAAAFLPAMLFSSPSAALPPPADRFDWLLPGADRLHREVYAVTRRGAETRPAVAGLLRHLRDVSGESSTPSAAPS